MRTKLLFKALCMAFMISKGHAQTQSPLIRIKPDVGQGYLVLNQHARLEVEKWVITINQHHFAMDGSSTVKPVDEVVLGENRNYWKVPTTYLGPKGNYSLTVAGLDIDGELVETEGPVVIGTLRPDDGSQPFEDGCRWVCNGIWYAWEVKQAVNPTMPLSGPSYFWVQQAIDEIDDNLNIGIPYYRYMSLSAFESLCPNADSPNSINGIPCSSLIPPIHTTDVLANSITDPYYDENGSVVQSEYVVGVMKGLGPWNGTNPWTTPMLNLGITACAEIDLFPHWGANIMNTYAPNVPVNAGYTGPNDPVYQPLTCTPSLSPNDDQMNIGNVAGCLHSVIQTYIDSLGVGSSFSVFQAMDDCFTGFGPVPIDEDWEFERIGNISKVVFHDLTNPTQTEATFDFSPNASPIGEITLGQGLHVMTVQSVGKAYVPVVFELSEKITLNVTMADLFGVTVYPVPIVSDEYTLLMNSADNLDFNYELVDHHGLVLNNEKFSMRKGEQRKHLVRVKTGIPNGLYAHRFIFSDGSVKAFNSVRN